MDIKSITWVFLTALKKLKKLSGTSEKNSMVNLLGMSKMNSSGVFVKED